MREIKIKEEWDKKKVGGNVQCRIKERMRMRSVSQQIISWDNKGRTERERMR